MVERGYEYVLTLTYQTRNLSLNVEGKQHKEVTSPLDEPSPLTTDLQDASSALPVLNSQEGRSASAGQPKPARGGSQSKRSRNRNKNRK